MKTRLTAVGRRELTRLPAGRQEKKARIYTNFLIRVKK